MPSALAAVAYCLLALVLAAPAQAKPPRFYGSDIAISGKWVWALGPLKYFGEGKLYYLGQRGWVQYPGMFTRVSVGPGGLVWAVEKDGRIKVGGLKRGWKTIAGRAVDIEVGAGGQVWMAGYHGRRRGPGLYRWTGAGWQPMKREAVRVAVDPAGKPWIVDRRLRIHRWQGGRFKRVYGTARDIAIGPGGQVWIIGGPRKGGTWRWNGTGWRRRGRGGSGLAVDAQGRAWVVDPKRGLYIYR